MNIDFKEKFLSNRENLLFLLLASFLLFFVKEHISSLPVADEWNYISTYLNNNTLDWNFLWLQHNEHRIVFFKIITFLWYKISNYNSYWNRYFPAIVLILSVFLWVKNQSRNNSKSPIWWPILLFLSLVQSENVIFFFQLSWMLLFLGIVIFSISFKKHLASKGEKGNIGLAVSILLASYSSLQGLLLPLFYIGFSALSFLFDRKNYQKITFLFTLYSLLVVACYYIGYFHMLIPPIVVDTISNPNVFFNFLFLMVSNSLKYNSHSFFLFSKLFTCLVIFRIIYSFILNNDKKKFILSFYTNNFELIIGFIFMIMVTLGRSNFANVAFRYSTFTMLFVWGGFVYLLSEISSLKWRKIFSNAVTILLILSYFKQFEIAWRLWGENLSIEKEVGECIKKNYPNQATQCKDLFKIVPPIYYSDKLFQELHDRHALFFPKS